MSVVSHRAEVQGAGRKQDDGTAGSDAALAALQSSLASYEQEKLANRTNITNSILPTPKNRFEAARSEKSSRKNGLLSSLPTSPSLSATATPRLGPAPTSVPASEDEVKLQAMKTPLVHLLAIRPATKDSMERKTHIPRSDLDEILQRCGKQVDGKWQLSDRAYRDLDVWKFGYPEEDDRRAAIENAVKAYDRMRLGKDENLWQLLLPKEERGKGKVLSRLHLGAGQVNRGLTPSYQPSPARDFDLGTENKAANGANTPRLGATTPRPGSSKGDVMKRLLSKDPKKARAAEDVKEKKRKEREAAPSDREGRPAKKQATGTKANANVKSAEFVHSSDEDSSDEVPIASQAKDRNVKTSNTLARKQRPAAAASSSSPDSGDAANEVKAKPKPKPAQSKPRGTVEKQTSSPAVKPAKSEQSSKSASQSSKNLTAPSPSHLGSQRSPQKHDSKPPVPSPLGAARPRVASDVSDRAAVGIQKVKSGGSETPTGLGITNGGSKVRPRAATATGASTGHKDSLAVKEKKSTTNGVTASKPLSNGTSHTTENGLKRKADHPTTQDSPAKHRKTDSTSSQPSKSARAHTPITTPNGTSSIIINSDETPPSLVDSITFNQGVTLAEKFTDIYYPAYAKLYDDLQAKERRGEKVSGEERERLMRMHRRVEQMKAEIVAASGREGERE